jgi:mannose-6-phosphate isomerase
VKYIFTSEKLSVQVHPNDDEARDRGLQRGKNECWYILDAEEGASLGLGLRSSVSAEDLRAAARGGSIEQLMDWRPVKAGDFYYVPAGTIHAIGAGITLLEVQQNSDVTYRLYDYGRPRELHLEDGVAVAKPGKYLEANARPAGGPLDTKLVDGPYFTLVRASSTDRIPPAMNERQRWVMPLEGQVASSGTAAEAGECILLAPGAPLTFSDRTVALIAA